jgi:hypothetical protein
MDYLLTLTLFGSVIWFWVSVLIFLTICFASDINKNGYYAFGSLVIVSVVYYFYGDIKAILQFLTLTNILIYLGIGFIIASFRTLFASKKLIKNLPEEKPKDYPYTTKKDAKDDFVKELEGNVTRWWFMWPISSISFLINDVRKFLYSLFKKYFEFILELGLK